MKMNANLKFERDWLKAENEALKAAIQALTAGRTIDARCCEDDLDEQLTVPPAPAPKPKVVPVPPLSSRREYLGWRIPVPAAIDRNFDFGDPNITLRFGSPEAFNDFSALLGRMWERRTGVEYYWTERPAADGVNSDGRV